jgi:hypothetical protein
MGSFQNMKKAKWHFRYAAVLACGLATGFAAAAQADPTMGPALKNMETMVTNLGYTTSESPDKTSFSINLANNNGNYIFDFITPDNGQTLVIYSPAQAVPLTAAAKMPVLDMLDFGDHSDNYYTVQKFSDHYEIFLNTELSTAGLTPVVLRVRLQAMIDDLDKSKAIWNSASWKK